MYCFATKSNLGYVLKACIVFLLLLLPVFKVESTEAVRSGYQLEWLSDLAFKVSITSLAEDAVADCSPYLKLTRLSALAPESKKINVTGRSRIVETFTPQWIPVIKTSFYFLLDEPLSPQDKYSFSVLWVDKCSRYDRVFLDYPRNDLARSGSVQVNQVGYLPSSPKYGYVGNWLGNRPMPVDTSSFMIIDSDNGEEVLTGKLRLRNENDSWSGNDVYEADFSSLTAEGRYFLYIPGVGTSSNFEIGPDVYGPIYRAVSRLFFHNRNSMPIDVEYADTGYARPEGGIPKNLDGVLHPVLANYPLSSGEKPGDYIPVQGGWFDAGDYGQYITNAAPVWYNISAALDLVPHCFEDNELDIPESGNGIPDMIDELRWGMRWALSMQNEKDGGVYWRIASERWDDSLPHQLDKPRFIYEKTTHATASFAAMAAIHARIIKPYDGEEYEQALNAAEKAWRFLEHNIQWPVEGNTYRNPKGTHAGEYPDPSAGDNILWAAAELYRTTGEKRYRDYYEANYQLVKFDPVNLPSFRRSEMSAAWAWVMAAGAKEDQATEHARKQILSSADWAVRQGGKSAYRVMIHDHPPYLGWGSFAQSTRRVLSLLQAYHISGKYEYLEWALISPSTQLGANPLSISFITGFGDHQVKRPVSKLMRFLENDMPLQGLPINGPHFHLPESLEIHRKANQYYLPKKSYPPFRRYIDSNLIPPMSEPTVAEYSMAVVAYALLNKIGESPENYRAN